MLCNLVVLESFWDGIGGKQAPRWFHINKFNHSGGRLYRLFGEEYFYVTDVVSKTQKGPKDHGEPDLVFFVDNVVNFPHDIDKLVVCGKTARQTFERAFKTKHKFQTKMENINQVLFMPHPAARMWTKHTEQAVKSVLLTDSKRYKFDGVGRKNLLIEAENCRDIGLKNGLRLTFNKVKPKAILHPVFPDCELCNRNYRRSLKDE